VPAPAIIDRRAGGDHLAPEAIGRGIGRALHDRALADLRERGFTEATLWVLREARRHASRDPVPSLDRPSVATTTSHTGAVVDERDAQSMAERADLILHIRGGEVANVGSWVYAWLHAGGDRRVIYVGATGLHPAVRAWLHLHHEDPEVGRVIARFPAAATDPLDMLALRLPDHSSRPDTKAALIALLAEEQLLSEHYVGDPPVPITAPAECVQQARMLVARIRAAGEQ
jgi:hypothetical protein